MKKIMLIMTLFLDVHGIYMSSNDPNYVVSSGAYKILPNTKKDQNRTERFKALTEPFLEDMTEKKSQDILATFSKTNKTTQMCLLEHYEKETLSTFCAFYLDVQMNDYGGQGLFLEKEPVDVRALLTLTHTDMLSRYSLKILSVLHADLKRQTMTLNHGFEPSTLLQEEEAWKKFTEAFHEEGAVQYCEAPQYSYGTGPYGYHNDSHLYLEFLIKRILFYRYLLSNNRDKALFGDRWSLPTLLLIKGCTDLEGGPLLLYDRSHNAFRTEDLREEEVIARNKASFKRAWQSFLKTHASSSEESKEEVLKKFYDSLTDQIQRSYQAVHKKIQSFFKVNSEDAYCKGNKENYPIEMYEKGYRSFLKWFEFSYKSATCFFETLEHQAAYLYSIAQFRIQNYHETLEYYNKALLYWDPYEKYSCKYDLKKHASKAYPPPIPVNVFNAGLKARNFARLLTF